MHVYKLFLSCQFTYSNDIFGGKVRNGSRVDELPQLCDTRLDLHIFVLELLLQFIDFVLHVSKAVLRKSTLQGQNLVLSLCMDLLRI